MFDRLLAPVAALIERMTSRYIYGFQFACKVVAQNVDGTVELQPDDPRLPSLSAVPIRHGLPGVSVKVAAGARVLLAFEGGSPSAPVVTLWDSSDVTEIVFAGGTKHLALAEDVEAQLSALKSAINGAVVAPGDGGATFKTNLMTALATWPGTTAASKLKA